MALGPADIQYCDVDNLWTVALRRPLRDILPTRGGAISRVRQIRIPSL
jgi:hypothetical protein